MKWFEIKHRLLGDPDGYVSTYKVQALTKEEAEHDFYINYEDLNYFVVSVEEVQS